MFRLTWKTIVLDHDGGRGRVALVPLLVWDIISACQVRISAPFIIPLSVPTLVLAHLAFYSVLHL